MKEAFPRAHPRMTVFIGVLNDISISYVNRLQDTATGRCRRPPRETIRLPAKQVFSGPPVVVPGDEGSGPDDDADTVIGDNGSGGGSGDNDSDGVGGDEEDNGASESVDGASDARESDDASEAKSVDYGVDSYIFD
jgi:hypothetical protein